MTQVTSRTWLIRGGIAAVAVAGGLVLWLALRDPGLPEGIVAANGRIEAVEIDISPRTPGRVLEILANEGQLVKAGEVIARMDTETLRAQLSEAQAGLAQARNSITISQTQVSQRQSERASAQAIVRQREAELNAARLRFSRSETLAREGATPKQERDDNRAAVEGAMATLEAARAQLASAESGIASAQSQVIGARSNVDAVSATIERVEADIRDSDLRAPRSGRIQFRVAQPGEVVAGGGRVVNLVDLSDVYMTFFVPTTDAGRLGIGTEVRLLLDAMPDQAIPAKISFVSDVAQFTPKTVETEREREKLMFRVRARIEPALLERHLSRVKTGLPGMAYVRIDPSVPWPEKLANVVKE
ncbi:HlyD family efflux transporter periplasmic adaptor subunit [Sandaracinobacter neustonicus]|jgi:HlyD family secretion protein|uniref:HlyD family efflux transporter periplasmic adaptor subunit n=1 Tax=Sandaracinobacter neustonicus TaxID=1715348 RepID=A0A501XSH8_9SPHN|nr:HlyD family efflux transporter periplasmic adaptor subunit [Sandaracinobacter neustonicus]TPE63057.1 HlyD family efflux transporter periplasmic adaptor subunit [Sandaracinobacter neustonicus]